MALIKHHLKIYLGFYLLWILLFFLVPACQEHSPLQALWLMSVVALGFVLAWSTSLRLKLAPDSMIHRIRLARMAVVETIIALAIFTLFALPAYLLLPSLQCPSQRSLNAEILALAMPVRNQVTETMLTKPQLPLEPTTFQRPEHDRVDRFEVMSDGRILVHATQPDFTLLLTPEQTHDNIRWDCTGYPARVAPAACQ